MTSAASLSPARRPFDGKDGDKALTRFLAVSAAMHVVAWGVTTYRRPAPPPPPEMRAALSVRSGDDEAPPDFMLYMTQAEMMRGTEEQLAKSFEGAAPKQDRSKDPESVLLSELTDSPPEAEPAPAIVPAGPTETKKKAPPARPAKAFTPPKKPEPAAAPPSEARPETTEAKPTVATPAPAPAVSETPATAPNAKDEALSPPPATPEPSEAAAATENSYAMDGGGDFGATYTYGVKAVSSSGKTAPAPAEAESPARRNYEHLLTAWISKFQRPPAKDVHGEGVLLFGVTRKGYVSVVSVIKSAGIAMLDEAAVTMIHDASPVIAPPPEYMPDEAVIYFAVPFRF